MFFAITMWVYKSYHSLQSKPSKLFKNDVKIITSPPFSSTLQNALISYLHFHTTGTVNRSHVKCQGILVSICKCNALIHAFCVKSNTLTHHLHSHYTHCTLKHLQCRNTFWPFSREPVDLGPSSDLHYLGPTSAYVHAKGHASNFKTVRVVTFERPKMPTILYIY